MRVDEPITTIDKIHELLAESGIELISYGLQPNPNGFCYEINECTTKSEMQRLENLLNSLTTKEALELRRIYL